MIARCVAGELGTKGPPEGCRRVKSDTLRMGIWLWSRRSLYGTNRGGVSGGHMLRWPIGNWDGGQSTNTTAHSRIADAR